MKRSVVGLLLVLVLAGASFAQWRDGQGKRVPDTPWSKSDGDFGAMFTFTDKPEALYSAWTKESPGVSYSETSTAVRGIPIVGVVFFTGCTANADGKCDLIGRFITTAPSGKPWGDPIDAEIWVGLPPPGKNALQLSHGHMGLIIDPGDELGEYTVRLELTDRVSKKQMSLERKFTAVESPKQEKK